MNKFNFIRSIGSIYNTLENKDKKKIIYLFFFIILTFFFEMLSISLVVPIVSLIFDDNFLNIIKNYSFVPDFIKQLSTSALLKLSLISIAAIYFLKTLFLIYFSFWKASFIYGLHQSYAKKLYFNYINQNYLFHLNSNSSNLTKNIVSTQNFAQNINQISILLTEIIILLGLLIILLFVNYKITLLIFLVTFLISLGFVLFVSPILSREGKLNVSNLKKFMENINSSFFAIKEIKIMNREDFFINRFNKNIKNFSDSEKLQEFIQSIPRFIMELFSILLLVISIFVMIYIEYDRLSIITYLALFAAVGFKLIPSINKIIFSIQHLKFYLPVSKFVLNDLALSKNYEYSNEKRNTDINYHDIRIKNLYYQYPRTKKLILKNINLKIKKYDVIGLTGSSGSGKSTLINCLIGFIKPIKGGIFFGDKSIYENLRSWQNNIGYVPQQVFLTDENMLSNIAFGVPLQKINKQKIYKASKLSKLDKFLKKKDDFKKVVGERGVKISGGQLQRVGIARALYNEKEVLIFDESTSSLDKETENEFLNSIKKFKNKKTIIIISHKESSLKLCNKIYKIHKGYLINKI